MVFLGTGCWWQPLDIHLSPSAFGSLYVGYIVGTVIFLILQVVRLAPREVKWKARFPNQVI